jgi:hypothetical protein
MTKRQKIGLRLAGLFAVGLLFLPAYRPLKFRYAIWRIESADTVAQERLACILASRVGHVWEINQIRTDEHRTLPRRLKHLHGQEYTEIEWWESPWWGFGGQPYRAYRILLDPKNRGLLAGRAK